MSFKKLWIEGVRWQWVDKVGRLVKRKNWSGGLI